MQRLTSPTLLVRGASLSSVMDEELLNDNILHVFTHYIFKGFFFIKNMCLSLSKLLCEANTWNLFCFQFLNDFSSGSYKFQRPKDIIMKLYVFLVNTGTTLTFDTELAVQK